MPEMMAWIKTAIFMRFLIYIFVRLFAHPVPLRLSQMLLNTRLKFIKPFYTHGAVVVDACFKYINVAASASAFSKVSKQEEVLLYVLFDHGEK